MVRPISTMDEFYANEDNRITKYGLVTFNQQKEIELRAYFKWLAGSEDTKQNWLDAEQEIIIK